MQNFGQTACSVEKSENKNICCWSKDEFNPISSQGMDLKNKKRFYYFESWYESYDMTHLI